MALHFEMVYLTNNLNSKDIYFSYVHIFIFAVCFLSISTLPYLASTLSNVLLSYSKNKWQCIEK